jgi:hypothetical protein
MVFRHGDLERGRRDEEGGGGDACGERSGERQRGPHAIGSLLPASAQRGLRACDAATHTPVRFRLIAMGG